MSKCFSLLSFYVFCHVPLKIATISCFRFSSALISPTAAAVNKMSSEKKKELYEEKEEEPREEFYRPRGPIVELVRNGVFLEIIWNFQCKDDQYFPSACGHVFLSTEYDEFRRWNKEKFHTPWEIPRFYDIWIVFCFCINYVIISFLWFFCVLEVH